MYEEILELLEKNYDTEDSVGLMLDRLTEAGVAVAPDAANEEVRAAYFHWVKRKAEHVMNLALHHFKNNL